VDAATEKMANEEKFTGELNDFEAVRFFEISLKLPTTENK